MQDAIALGVDAAISLHLLRSGDRMSSLRIGGSRSLALMPGDGKAEQPDVRSHAVRGLVGSVLLACFFADGLVTRLAAQSVQVVRSVTRCDSCQLAIEHVVTLGGMADSISLFGGWPSVQHDSRGRFLAAGALPSTSILVYSGSGELEETWGRQGRGPGEFQSIWRLVLLPDDSLLVLDQGSRVLTILDSAGRYARSHVMQFQPIEIEPLSSVTWLASGTAHTAELTGLPLHRLAPDGSIVESFGGGGTVLSSRPSAAHRMIARAGNGIWAARPDRYELEYWTASGTKAATLDRESEWFPDRDVEGARNTWRDPPMPWIRDLYVDAQGLVWVLAVARDSTWRASPDQPPASFAGLDRVYDSVLEVIHPESGELLASARQPWHGDAFTNDGLVISHRETAAGLIVIDVWRVTLTGWKGAH